MLSTQAPDVALVDISDAAKASVAMDRIEHDAPKVPLVGFSIDGATSLSSTIPVLGRPYTLEGLFRVIRHAVHAKYRRPLSNVTVFLPSKAGAGASTVVLNTAGHLAHSFEQKVLVIEGDLRSGVLSAVLNVKPQRSAADTLQGSDALGSMVWDQQALKTHGIDFILATRERGGYLPSWHDYVHLLRFVSSRYDQIIVDLPEVINDATVEVIESARAVYVVTTPELPSLRLAEQRIEDLQSTDMEKHRIRLLLNRWQQRDPKSSEIAESLGFDVDGVFPNDYPAVKKSIIDSEFVSPHTEVGKAFRSFAGFMLGKNAAPQLTKPKPGLLNMFRRDTEEARAAAGK